jgi:hypothetical protein
VISTRILIKFAGASLRYMGSDERSQALLLKKALDRAMNVDKSKSQKMVKSTPGIFVKCLQNGESILGNIKDIEYDKIVVFEELKKENEKIITRAIEDLENHSKYCYIYLFPQNSKKGVELLRSIDEEYNLIYINLSTIKGTEDKILYINFLIDQKEKSDIKIRL